MGPAVMEAAGLAAFVETLRARGAVRARGVGFDLPRAGAARRDGRHRRLLGVARPRAPDRRSGLGCRTASRSPAAGNRQPWPAGVHDSARGAGARRCARRLRRHAPHVRGESVSLGGVHRGRRARPGAGATPAGDVGRTDRRRLGGARGKGRELVGRGGDGQHVRRGGRIRAADRAARSGDSLPDRREPRGRRAVRRDGPDDVRVRRAGGAAGAPLSTRGTAGAGARSPTTSLSGASIRASVTPWANPTTAPFAPGRSWGCGSSPITSRCRGTISPTSRPKSSSGSWRTISRRRWWATDFLARYGGTIDPVTSVAPGRRYRVRAPAAHPVYERWRVETFRDLLLTRSGETDRRRLGELMYESHASYGRCGLGSEGTDRLVALVRAEGPPPACMAPGLPAAAAAAPWRCWGGATRRPPIARVADAYERQTGYRPQVFAGSSPGCDGVRQPIDRRVMRSRS